MLAIDGQVVALVILDLFVEHLVYRIRIKEEMVESVLRQILHARHVVHTEAVFQHQRFLRVQYNVVWNFDGRRFTDHALLAMHLALRHEHLLVVVHVHLRTLNVAEVFASYRDLYSPCWYALWNLHLARDAALHAFDRWIVRVLERSAVNSKRAVERHLDRAVSLVIAGAGHAERLVHLCADYGAR